MKTTRKRERDRARGEDNVFCTREQDFSLRGLWIFFFSSSFLLSFFFFFFFVVVTDISPHFPRDQKSILDHPFNIKSGRYLYTQQTQFAAAILRSFTDVSLTDNKDPFLSFFFYFHFFQAATGRDNARSCSWGEKTDATLCFFFCFPHFYLEMNTDRIPVLSSVTFTGAFIRQTLGAVFMAGHSTELPPTTRTKTERGWVSFPHGYPGNEARKLDSRRQPLSAPYDMPQIPPKDSLREATTTLDYFILPSLFQLLSPIWIFFFFLFFFFKAESNYFSSELRELSCNCPPAARCNLLKWGETRVLLCNIRPVFSLLPEKKKNNKKKPQHVK